MTRIFSLAAAATMFLLASSRSSARPADAAQVKVALLDGQPVYHWRIFASQMPDDIDRALIVREFYRRKYVVPGRLVDEAIEKEVQQHYSGDKHQFVDALAAKGVGLADYRRFRKEEIIVNAMWYHDVAQPGRPKPTGRQWLASLRKGARIIVLRKDQP